MTNMKEFIIPLAALTSLTEGKVYKGTSLYNGMFYEIYPTDKGEVLVFAYDRFEAINE